MFKFIRISLRNLVDRIPSVALALRYIRDQRKLLGRPVHTCHGFDFIGNKEMQNGTFEQEEVKSITRLLSNVDTFINIGANIGYYCCIAGSLGKHVIAFEPIPLNVKGLLKNLRTNGFDKKSEIYPLALSNTVGIVDIYGAGTGASLIHGWAGTPEWHVTSVPCTTWDLIVGKRTSGQRCLVLVDVEGAELFVLKGASTLLTQTPRPIWALEVCLVEHQPHGQKTNQSAIDVFELFRSHGYTATILEGDGREITITEIAEVVRTGIDTIRSHNFLFTPTQQSPI